MKFTSKDTNPLIAEGEHVAVIERAYIAEKLNEEYGDKAKQLVVIFKTKEDKQITRWFNLKGFQVDADKKTKLDANGHEVPNYLTDKVGKRLESKDNTDACKRIVGRLGNDAGIAEGEDFDESELEGKEVGIRVIADNKFDGKSRLKVAYTLPASQVSVSATSEAFAE